MRKKKGVHTLEWQEEKDCIKEHQNDIKFNKFQTALAQLHKEEVQGTLAPAIT